MEDPSTYMNQWQMNYLDELSMLPLATSLGENLHLHHPSFNLKASLENSYIGMERPMKHHKVNGWNSGENINHLSNSQVLASASPNIFSLMSSNYTNQMGLVKPKEEAVHLKSINTVVPSDALVSQGCFTNQNYVLKANQGAKRISTNTKLSQTKDHILAERKRREKLSQRFIALSAIVPGLKKVQLSISMAVCHLR